MHKRAAENARFVVNQKLGDRHLTVADLKEQIQNGNQSQGRKVCILVQDLAAAHNTGHRKGQELRALIQYEINEGAGLPSYHSTGIYMVICLVSFLFF